MNANQLFLLTTLTAVLGACGGGGGSDAEAALPQPPQVQANDVPASAWASIQSFTGYLRSLANSDSAEPLDVSKVRPPTSDSEEPREL